MFNELEVHGAPTATRARNLQAKEFWKSVTIWGSYGQEFTVLFLRNDDPFSRFGIIIGKWDENSWISSAVSIQGHFTF